MAAALERAFGLRPVLDGDSEEEDEELKLPAGEFDEAQAAGWDDSLFKEEEEKLDELRCPICICVLRDAVVMNCGHGMCHPCALNMYGSVGHLWSVKRCPECRARTTDIIPDYHKRRLVKNLLMECPCGREIRLSQLSEHSRGCEKSSPRIHRMIVSQDLRRLKMRVRRLEREHDQMRPMVNFAVLGIAAVAVGVLMGMLLGARRKTTRFLVAPPPPK